jgi:hypothetical protein
MLDHVDEEHPRVFLCFAAADHTKAERLARDLRSRGVAIASYEYSIGPGENIALAAERALTQSDYFVLLWSRSAVDKPWIDEQWTAAFVHGLRERRRFLFVVRLDEETEETRLPMLLATRPHLDAYGDWDEAVNELVSTWSRERAFGHPILPAPCPAERRAQPGYSIVLYARNQALNVSHVLVVPARSTGRDLQAQIRAELRLPDQVSEFQDSVGLRFTYQFMNDDEPLRDEPLTALGLTDGGCVDIVVEVEPFGPDGPSTWQTYLGPDEEPELSPALLRSLVDLALGHLMPWN